MYVNACILYLNLYMEVSTVSVLYGMAGVIGAKTPVGGVQTDLCSTTGTMVVIMFLSDKECLQYSIIIICYAKYYAPSHNISCTMKHKVQVTT